MEPLDRQAKTVRDLAGKFELFSEIYSRTVKDLSARSEGHDRSLERLMTVVADLKNALDRVTWSVADVTTQVEENTRLLRGHNGADGGQRGLQDLVHDHRRRFVFQDKLLWLMVTALFALALSSWWNRPTISEDQWRAMRDAVLELQRQQSQRGRPGATDGVP